MKKSKKSYSTTPVIRLVDYLKQTQTTPASFAYKIGISSGCVSSWIVKDKMPQHIGVLIDSLNALRATDAPKAKPETVSMIISGKADSMDALVMMAEKLELQSIKLDL